ncbi:MAG: hypothetical protein GX335_03905 [Firmicutes bacterium]|nr:hypothetical protein [Bacillota bacterium]
MVKPFWRDLIIVACTFLLIFGLIQTDLEFVKPLREYVLFVVATNFSFRPILEKVPFLQKLGNWDLRSFLDNLPPVSAGR